MRLRGARAQWSARSRSRRAWDSSLSRLEEGMAHTFLLVRRFLSGLVSGGFGVFRGWNGLDSAWESSEGSCQVPERMVDDAGIAWLDL